MTGGRSIEERVLRDVPANTVASAPAPHSGGQDSTSVLRYSAWRSWYGDLGQLSGWSRSQWVVAVVVAATAAMLMGSPTDLVPTHLFERMSPTVWWNYPVWVLSALLIGLIVATYVRPGIAARRDARAGRTIGSGIVTVLAVGCPVCNKLVVFALGTSGALNVFGPVQPVLGVVAVGLLTATLMARLARNSRCPAPAPHNP